MGVWPMASTMTVTCDRCKGVIDRDRTLLRVETGVLRRTRPELDLCAGCLRAFEAWLDAGGAKGSP